MKSHAQACVLGLGIPIPSDEIQQGRISSTHQTFLPPKTLGAQLPS